MKAMIVVPWVADEVPKQSKHLKRNLVCEENKVQTKRRQGCDNQTDIINMAYFEQ